MCVYALITMANAMTTKALEYVRLEILVDIFAQLVSTRVKKKKCRQVVV